MELNKIIHSDCLEGLKSLPDECIDCAVTSPPYWGLRDYGTAEWKGGDENCEHSIGNQVEDNKAKGAITSGVRPSVDATKCKKCGAKRIDQQLGLEKTPEEFVEKMVGIFAEVKRVLKPTGTLWLNLGDSYASGKGTCNNPGGGSSSLAQKRKQAGAHPLDRGNLSDLAASGIKPKDLVGMPWMVAFALRADSWYLRQDIIWHKRNPMPESVTDRCTKAHEQIFLLTKSGKATYWVHRGRPYQEGVLKKPKPDYRWINLETDEETEEEPENWKESKQWRRINLWRGCDYYYDAEAIKTEGKNPEDDIRRVQGAIDGHKSNPDDKKNGLRVRIPAGWDTDRGSHGNIHKYGRAKEIEYAEIVGGANKRSVWSVRTEAMPEAHFATFPQQLIIDCIKAGCPEDGVVLDPFMGAGTTALVARKQNRNFIGFELNEEYIQIAEKRLEKELGMFA